MPVLVQMGIWGRTYLPVSEELKQKSIELEQGGPLLWEQIMFGLREAHFGPSRAE